VIALGAVATVALGLAGLRSYELPGPRPISDGERLRIEVVQPVEPKIVPGSVMDVGEVVDGFQGLPPPLPALTDVSWSSDDGWGELPESDAGPPSGARRVSRPEPYYSRVDREEPSPVQVVQRWFGFDAPRRDYQAERAARRARMEAMEQRAREEREVRRRDWVAREREWAERDQRRDRERWREVGRARDERPMADLDPDHELALEAFTGPQ